MEYGNTKHMGIMAKLTRRVGYLLAPLLFSCIAGCRSGWVYTDDFKPIEVLESRFDIQIDKDSKLDSARNYYGDVFILRVPISISLLEQSARHPGKSLDSIAG